MNAADRESLDCDELPDCEAEIQQTSISVSGKSVTSDWIANSAQALQAFTPPDRCDRRGSDDPGEHKVGHRTAGLQNLGNTCFMNSALQCVANIPDIKGFVLAQEAPAVSPDAVLVEFQKLMVALWDQRSGTVNPAALKESVSQCTSAFTDWEQHDAMEFLEFLINRLAEGLEFSGAEDQSQSTTAELADDLPIQARNHKLRSLFTGYLETTIVCPRDGCAARRARVEAITSIKLPNIDPKLSEHDNVAIIIVPTVSSGLPAAEQRVFVEHSATVEMLLNVAAAKANLERSACLCADLEDGRLRIWPEQDSLNSIRTRGPFLVYELEAEADAACFISQQADNVDSFNVDEKRVCPDDGMTYTFAELKAAFGTEYSADDLRSYWHDAMAIAPSELPSGAQSGVIVHCRVASSRRLSRVLVGVPLLFSMDRVTSQSQLVDAIKVQLMLRYRLEDVAGWSLYQTSAGWDAAKADTKLCHEASPGQAGELALRACEHLVVHWEASPPSQLLSTSIVMGAEDEEEIYTLETCFDWLTGTQELSIDNAVLCEGCKQKVPALSRVQLACVPPVLILHLNRFEYKYGQRNRLFTPIRFPLDGLDLTRFHSSEKHHLTAKAGTSVHFADVCSGPPVYDLLATIIHAGSACLGHYTAYIRSGEGGWYLYNDETVKQVGAADVQADLRGSYVFFYLHREARPSAWGRPDD